MKTTFISRQNSTALSLRNTKCFHHYSKTFCYSNQEYASPREYYRIERKYPVREWPLQVLYWKDYSMHRVGRVSPTQDKVLRIFRKKKISTVIYSKVIIFTIKKMLLQLMHFICYSHILNKKLFEYYLQENYVLNKAIMIARIKMSGSISNNSYFDPVSIEFIR